MESYYDRSHSFNKKYHHLYGFRYLSLFSGAEKNFKLELFMTEYAELLIFL